MPSRFWPIISLPLLILCGCTGIDITRDYDPEVDFAALRTFAWSPDPPFISGTPTLADPDLHASVRNAVEAQMAAKGLTRKTSGEPDFWIAYSLALETSIDIRALNAHHEYPSGWGWDQSRATELGWGGGATYLREFTEGTLVIDLVEPESRRLLWRASALAAVHSEPEPERRDRRINQAVQKMLRKFPP